MITKVVYIHKDQPYDVYQKDIQNPEILPNIIESINFFQDLFVPSIEGEIIISDFAMYDLLPLQYEDKIRIYTVNPIYNSSDKSFSIGKDYYTEFRIISADMISPEPNITDKDNFKQFALRIIDDSSFKGYLEKQSVMYKDKTITDIVKNVITPIFKANNVKVNPSISTDKFDITFPKWSIYQRINYLTKFTEFSDGTGCVYFNSLPIYYENRQTEYTFNYTNLSALMKNNESFIDEEYSLTSDINRIYNLFLEKDNNYFEFLNNGTNINNVKIVDTNNRSKLNKYKPFISKLNNDVKYEFLKPTSFWGLNYEYNYLMKNMLDNIHIYFTVSGDYKRKIGTVINLKFPSGFSSLNKKDFYDEKHTGKYLIKSMEHIFVKDDNQQWVYNQKIGLITDGYSEDEFGILEI